MSGRDYDAVIVGARCAGAPAALLLARAGYRVLLLERSRVPQDTLCTHHVVRAGLEALEGWGLLDQLLDTGMPPMRSVVHEVDGRVRISGPVPAVGRMQGMYAPRRKVLDDVLVRAAVEAGAEFRDETTVTDVVAADGRITGVRYRGRGGTGVVNARLVVGADGMRSSVARFVGAGIERADPKASCVYYAYWDSLHAVSEIYQRAGNFVGVDLTHDDLAVVVSYFRQQDFERVRRDPWHAYVDSIRATAPDLADRLAESSTVERLRGSGSQFNFYRQPTGPGWVLLGDAGCTKDSIMGTGISDAFRQAELLVDNIGAQLRDERLLSSALQRFAHQRHHLLDEGYRMAVQSAQLRIDPGQLEFLAWVQTDAEATARFIEMVVGASPAQPSAAGVGA